MYLGLDIGTSAVKAVLMDESQRVLATETAPLDVSRPHPGWSEQDPESWWRACEAVLDKLAAVHGHYFAALKGIGLSGHMHGATLLDKSGKPLRPCILWNDVRAASEAAELDGDERFRRITGNIVFPGFTAPKLAWLRRHEPEVFSKTACVLLPKDYVRLQLTGELATDMSDAAGTAWLDAGRRAWSDELLSATGLSSHHMPVLHEGTEVTGVLRAELASRWVYIEKSSNDKDAIARDSSIIINNYVFAYEVYKMEGNFEKSLENLEKLTSSYTHIFTRENQNKITTLELKQQEEKHEYELQLSAERLKNKENEIKMYYISIILSTIILVMLVIFIYKQKKNNKQLQILNKDLTESNSVKNQILGIINHDLRQPVASLIGFLQIKNVLSSDDVSSDEMLKLNKQAMQMTENLLFSMEDLLQWSKNIMSNYSLSLSTFKVSKLYEELKIFFNNNDKITFNYNSDFEITTEFNYLKTILRNLISNSLKASESENPQKVLCQISASEGRICFKVSNNGPEMSQKVIDSLIGNRLDYSSSDGLGLRLIYDLSQAINGKISVSQQEGQTTVELSIDNQSC